MKNFLWLLLTQLFFIRTSFGQKADIRPDTKKMGLKGWVKNIKKINFTGIDSAGQIIIGKTDSIQFPRVLHFNKVGKLDSILNLYSNGNIEGIETFKYNDQGLMIEKIILSRYRQVLNKQSIEYDKHDFMIKITTTDGTGESLSIQLNKYLFKDSNHYSYTNSFIDLKNKHTADIIFRFSFSKNGNLIDKTTEYPKKPNSETKIKYFYNAKNQIIYSTVEESNTNTFSKQNSEYDEFGNLIRFRETIPSNDILNTYEYNEKGDWTKMVSKRRYIDYATGMIKNSVSITIREITYY